VATAGLFEIQFFLIFDGAAGKWHRFETGQRDGIAGALADAILSCIDAHDGLIDFIEGILLLREDAQCKIAVVRITSRVGLVHAEGGGFRSVGTFPEIVAGNTGHLIEECVAKIEQLLPLCFEERRGRFLLFLFVMVGRMNRGGRGQVGKYRAAFDNKSFFQWSFDRWYRLR